MNIKKFDNILNKFNLNNKLVISISILLMLYSTFFWIKKLATVIFVDGNIPQESINFHTYQGSSILFVLFMLIYFISNKPIFTLFLTNTFLYLFYFANITKFDQRADIVYLSEFREIVNLKTLAEIVPLTRLFILLGVVVIVLVILFWVERKVEKYMNLGFSRLQRLCGVVVILLMLLPIKINSEQFAKHYFNIEISDTQVFNMQDTMKKDGFMPYFIKNASVNIVEKPSGFNKNSIDRIGNKYKTIAKKENKNKTKDIRDEHTIIYLSESLWDYESVLMNGPAAPFINEMKQKNGGNMYTQYIGGGTANLEFSVLTSMSLELHSRPQAITPYVEYFNQSHSSATILSLFNKKDRAAMHPFNYDLYNRVESYKKMGINDMYSEKNMDGLVKLPGSERVSDASFNQFIMKNINKYKGINALSMQNHSTYPDNILMDSTFKPEFKPGILADTPNANPYGDYKGFAETYFKQLRYTDEAFKQTVNEMDNSELSINLLVYGDHGPSFLRGKNDLVGETIYETPYFIYRNHRENRNQNDSDKVVSPIFLIPELLNQDDYKMTPYYYLMTDLMNKDITRIGPKYVYINNKHVNDEALDKPTRALVESYRIVEYDRFFGDNRLSDKFYNDYFE